MYYVIGILLLIMNPPPVDLFLQRRFKHLSHYAAPFDNDKRFWEMNFLVLEIQLLYSKDCKVTANRLVASKLQSF